jgi:hypothetical protein
MVGIRLQAALSCRDEAGAGPTYAAVRYKSNQILAGHRTAPEACTQAQMEVGDVHASTQPLTHRNEVNPPQSIFCAEHNPPPIPTLAVNNGLFGASGHWHGLRMCPV